MSSPEIGSLSTSGNILAPNVVHRSLKGVEIGKFLTCPGTNGHNVLAKENFTCPLKKGKLIPYCAETIYKLFRKPILIPYTCTECCILITEPS